MCAHSGDKTGEDGRAAETTLTIYVFYTCLTYEINFSGHRKTFD